MTTQSSGPYINEAAWRARTARALVRWVSRWIQAGYQANCEGHRRMERFFNVGGRRVQAFAFPIARHLDRNAMVEQMARESWWG